MYTHSCIKNCGAKYTSKDPDPYYCDSCNEARLAIAKEIDAKVAAIGPKATPPSLLQTYENAPKTRGFVHASVLMPD